MIHAAHILLDWWNQMAQMYAKYGTPSDIENKPEWPKLQEKQDDLLHVLSEHTGTAQDILFDNIQRALQQVLDSDEETVLSLGDASKVVALAISLSLQEEAQAARTTGCMN